MLTATNDVTKLKTKKKKKTRIFGRVKYHQSKINVVFVRMYWYLLIELELTLTSCGISACDSSLLQRVQAPMNICWAS